MSGDAPYESHNPVLLLLLLLTGVIATPWLAVRAGLLLARTGARRTRRTLLKGAVALAWAGMIGMYTWGLLHLFFLDESNQAKACQETLGPEKIKNLNGYESSFVPLRFGCRTESGRTYEAAIPGYVNPVTGLLGVTSIVLTGYAIRSDKKLEQTTT